MPDLKIILAVQSQLLREMLTRVFAKLEDFVFIKEINNPVLLAEVLEQTDIDWVIFSFMHLQEKMEWINDLIRLHPSVCFAGISLDKDQVTFSWLNNLDTEVKDLSLEDFIAILESGCKCQPT